MWIHLKKKDFIGKTKDENLYKKLTIKSLTSDLIKTNFGTYFLENGKNILSPCGCKRFCECYGKLFLISE